MLSTPPATNTSPSPVLMARDAALIAARPDEQRRLKVRPATETGKPARRAAIRATFRLSSPAWFAQPRYTSSTRAGSTPARRTTSPTTSAARSSGRTSLSAPWCRPIGVRTAPTITASVILHSSNRRIAREDLDFGVTTGSRHFRIPPPEMETSPRGIPLLRGMKWRSAAALAFATSTDGGTSTSGITSGRTDGRRGRRITSVAWTRSPPGPISCAGWPSTTGRRSRNSPGGGPGSKASLRRLIPPLRGTFSSRGPWSASPLLRGGECLSPFVGSSTRASPGAALRRIRPRRPPGRMPAVHGRGEDGPLRHGPLFLPLFLLSRLGREDVQGRRLRGREARHEGRGRPRGGPGHPGDRRGDHRRRPPRRGRTDLPVHPPPEDGARSDVPHAPVHHVYGCRQNPCPRRSGPRRDPIPRPAGPLVPRRGQLLRRSRASRAVPRPHGRDRGSLDSRAGGGPRPPDRVGRGGGPRLREPERDGVLRRELPPDESPRV